MSGEREAEAISLLRQACENWPHPNRYDWAVDVLEAALSEARRERDEAMGHLREFNHVEGEPLSEVAAVAASAYGFAKHAEESLRRELAAKDEALRAIRSWDCLNPPRADLLADLPWLRRLVDSALAGSSTTETEPT